MIRRAFLHSELTALNMLSTVLEHKMLGRKVPIFGPKKSPNFCTSPKFHHKNKIPSKVPFQILDWEHCKFGFVIISRKLVRGVNEKLSHIVAALSAQKMYFWPQNGGGADKVVGAQRLLHTLMLYTKLFFRITFNF